MKTRVEDDDKMSCYDVDGMQALVGSVGAEPGGRKVGGGKSLQRVACCKTVNRCRLARHYRHRLVDSRMKHLDIGTTVT